MTLLHTPERMARFFAFMEYEHDESVKALLAEFPRLSRARAEEVMRAAEEFEKADQQDIDQLAADEAVAAEHDLTKSIWRKQ